MIGTLCLLLHPLQPRGFVLGQTIKVVHQIDQQELPGELWGEMRFPPKIKRAFAKIETAMALVVVNDGLVVELR